MSGFANERTLEAELAALQSSITRLDGERQVAHDAAEKLVADERAAGRDPLTDPESFTKVDAAYRAADDLAEQITDTRNKASLAMRMLGRSVEAATAREGVPSSSAVAAIMATPEYRRLLEVDAFASAGARIELPGVEVASRAQALEAFKHGGPLFTATADVGDLITPDSRRFPPVPIPVRPIRVLDLITMGTTNSDVVQFVRETLRDDVAAETALGTAYAEASYEYELDEANVRDIGHFTPAHRSNLADEGQLQALLEGRLETGVQLRFESQIVSGNGLGQNLEGILNTDGIGYVERNTTGNERVLEVIHRGITKVRLNLFAEPDAIGIHPSDYELAVFEKGSDGQYLLGPASQATARTIWGFPAAISSVFPQHTSLVGNYKTGAVAWLRSGVTVRASDSHEDFFTKRMVALLAEMRSAFAAWQAPAFCEVNLT